MATFSDPTRPVWRGERSKIYYVRLYENGKQTWRLRDTKGERAVDDVTLGDAIDAWFRTKEDRLSQATVWVYSTYRNHWKKNFRVSMTLRAVQTENIDAYLRKRKKSGISPRSLNNERARLREFFGFCVDRGWLVRNPAKPVERYRETKRKIRALNEAEQARLLEEAPKAEESFHGFVLCLLRSGLRRGTIAKLEWGDIDFHRGEWQIPAEKMKSKEDFSDRPIADDLLTWFRARRKSEGLVFGPIEPKRWETTVNAAGLQGLRPHDCRRTFLTHCRKHGVPMEVAMHLSDHRDLRTVLECYRGVDTDEARQHMRRLFWSSQMATQDAHIH